MNDRPIDRKNALRLVGLAGFGVLAGCAGVGGAIPEFGSRVPQGGSLPVSGVGNSSPPPSTPSPQPLKTIAIVTATCTSCSLLANDYNTQFGFNAYTSYGFSSGGGMTQEVPVTKDNSWSACLTDSLHALGADATALAVALKANWSKFSGEANAAKISSLLGDYEAGAIGALDFITSVMAFMTVGDWAILLALAGLTGWSLWNTFKCFHDQGG